MRTDSLLRHCAYAMLSSIVLVGTAAPAVSQELPSYMAPITGRNAVTAAETATNNVLALNTGMFELYGDAAKIFKRNILSKHPVILGLFSGAGGRFILERRVARPIETGPAPSLCEYSNSNVQITMALACSARRCSSDDPHA